MYKFKTKQNKTRTNNIVEQTLFTKPNASIIHFVNVNDFKETVPTNRKLFYEL